MITRTPQTLSEVSALASDVYERLVAKYNAEGQRFIDDDNDNDGLIFPCAGSVALLLLATNFDVVGKDGRWQEIVSREFDRVRQHIEEKGYDATPFVSERITEKLFSRSAGYYYTDSLSWVLSLTTQIRVAVYRSGILEAPQGLMENVNTLMKDALEKICDSACPQGGWNFSNGCSAPHLYYSFAVTEALADFGDYVLGETPRLFGKNSQETAKDSDLIKFLTGDLVERVNEKRKMTLKYLVETYLEKLGENEIEPMDYPLGPEFSTHNLLYYTFFVLEMLVTCNLEDFYPEWSDKIDDATEMGIYLSRLDLAKGIRDKTPIKGGVSWFDNLAESTLKLEDWSLFAKPNLIPDRGKLTKLVEPGLIPLAVRCNAQYAYYVAKGKDLKMRKLFTLLLDDRDGDTHRLWDSQFYNLLITERAIEAIVDYYDYLNEYEKESAATEVGAAKQSKIDAAFREILKDEVQAYLAESGKSVEPTEPGGEATGVGGPQLNEETLVKKLISTLATANSYAKGGDGEGLPVEQKDIKRLQDNFRVFLTNLFCESLADVYPEEQDKLRTAVPAHVQDLWVALAPWIAETQKAKLGNLFSHLADETLKSVETGRGGAKGSQK